VSTLVNRFIGLFARTEAVPIRVKAEPVRITKVRRIPRNYVEADITMARRLLAVTRHYIRVLREIGLSGNDGFVVGWLHALPLSLASQSFPDLYDEMLNDSRITDSEKDLIASAVLDCQAVEIDLTPQTHGPHLPEAPRADAGVVGISREATR